MAVISPFLDKSHGTERRVVEWVSHLANNFETHIYSQHVEDVDFSKVVWHRIPKLPGPHLVNFVWWLAANHLWRSWDRHVRGLRHDLIFSPGVNCLDADAVSVHIVFAEYVRRVGKEINLLQSPSAIGLRSCTVDFIIASSFHSNTASTRIRGPF